MPKPLQIYAKILKGLRQHLNRSKMSISPTANQETTMVQSASIDLGLVSHCNVINCIYNSDQQCTAGAVKVTFDNNLPQCYTYTTSEPEPGASPSVGVVGAGDVSQCDVIDCTYNEGQRCMAESITVTFGEDMAQCATYTQ